MINLAHKSDDSASADSIKLLITDDDKDILESLQDMLEYEYESLTIRTADSVDTAIKIAEDFHPDIALLDIKIGKDNGLDLIPALKQISPDTICIMMTAFRDASYAATAVKYGASDYLFKPIEPNMVLATLRRQIEFSTSLKDKREIQRRFQSIFTNSFDLLILVDRSLNIIDCNLSAQKYTDMRKSDLVGRGITDVCIKMDITSEVSRIVSACNLSIAGESTDGIIKCGPLHFKYIIKPLDDENPQSPIIIQMHDITSSVLYKQQIEDSNQKLEQMVVERTAELEQSLILLEKENDIRKQTEVSLLKAKHEAELANMAKSDFMTRASHNLRTPMNAILGFSQLLDADSNKLTVEQHESVTEILEAGNHLLSLIDDVLEISEIESGNYKPDLQEINISTIIVNCIAKLEPLWDINNIRIEINEFTDDVVYSDARLVNQIVLNLLSNAILYNKPSGYACVTIQPAGDSMLRISVKDTGIGIPHDLQDVIFEPFERLNHKTGISGSGTGLTVVKRLIEALGGGLGLSSEPNKGSLFWFDLPRSVQD
ncbi:MAG: response regulator [Proteobacteria bacterium]|nr:response regulator [Pseudomonadota bacterium]